MSEQYNEMFSLAHQKTSVFFAGLGNGSALAIGFNTGDFSVAAIGAFCTVTIPIVVGGFNYIVKNAGPVWLDYLARRNEIQAQYMGTQMENLAAQLKIATQREGLANIQRDQAQSRLEERERQAQSEREEIKAKLEEKSLAEKDSRDKIALMASQMERQTVSVSENQVLLKEATERIKILSDTAAAAQSRAELAEAKALKAEEQLRQIAKNTAPSPDTHQKIVEVQQAVQQVQDTVHTIAEIQSDEHGHAIVTPD